MNLRHIEMFLAVCENNSFSQTASRLGTSEPAISRIVRSLEASFAVKLFDRTGRGVRLTSSGEVFRTRCRAILREVNNLQTDMKRLSMDVPGEVNLSIPLRQGQSLMLPITQRFSERFPNATLHVREGLQEQNQSDLWAGNTDISILCVPPDPVGSVATKLKCHLLCKVEMSPLRRNGSAA